jgi:hypothetical protein
MTLQAQAHLSSSLQMRGAGPALVTGAQPCACAQAMVTLK